MIFSIKNLKFEAQTEWGAKIMAMEIMKQNNMKKADLIRHEKEKLVVVTSLTRG